jgi:hypothetical protein
MKKPTGRNRPDIGRAESDNPVAGVQDQTAPPPFAECFCKGLQRVSVFLRNCRPGFDLDPNKPGRGFQQQIFRDGSGNPCKSYDVNVIFTGYLWGNSYFEKDRRLTVRAN